MFKRKMCTRSMARSKPKVSVGQLRKLLSAVESDPSLYNEAESDMITSLNAPKWLKLSQKLNECSDGAELNAQSWKYLLRYWAANVRKGVNPMSKDRLAYNKANPSLTLWEAKELTCLEKRFYAFMKKEDAKEIVDVTYTGNFGVEQPTGDIAGASDNGIKVKVQLVNVSEAKVNDENASPDGPRKRCIHVKEDDPIDPADVTKKLKIIFDANLEEGEPEQQSLTDEMDRLHVVSRELEDHISTIQSRIHMIKDLWKHRCGDN